MNNNRIIFICPYNSPLSQRDLAVTPSSVTYSQYLIDAIHESTASQLVILSLATGKNKAYKKIVVNNGSNEEQVYFSCLNPRNIFLRRFNQLYLYFQVFFNVLFKSQKGDKIFIYHDYGFSFFLNLLILLAPRKYIYVVAEVFNAVYERSETKIKKEIKRLQGASAYIFINTLLPNIFHVTVPYAVCSGNYRYTKDNNEVVNDGLTHVVYAGKISAGSVSDAFLALESSRFYRDSIRLHILGYGQEKDIQLLQAQINEINTQRGIQIVSYEGCLSGSDYDAFLSRCQIGLSTRALPSEYAQYCFPSKTMVYLGHGLITICPDIPVFRSCDFSDTLYLVDNPTPENIAQAVNEAGNVSVDFEKRIDELHTEFLKNLELIIKQI